MAIYPGKNVSVEVRDNIEWSPTNTDRDRPEDILAALRRGLSPLPPHSDQSTSLPRWSGGLDGNLLLWLNYSRTQPQLSAIEAFWQVGHPYYFTEYKNPPDDGFYSDFDIVYRRFSNESLYSEKVRWLIDWERLTSRSLVGWRFKFTPGFESLVNFDQAVDGRFRTTIRHEYRTALWSHPYGPGIGRITNPGVLDGDNYAQPQLEDSRPRVPAAERRTYVGTVSRFSGQGDVSDLFEDGTIYSLYEAELRLKGWSTELPIQVGETLTLEGQDYLVTESNRVDSVRQVVTVERSF